MVKEDLRRQYRFLMWGGGIFLIVIGVGLLLIVSLLIGESMMLLYPYINDTVLLVIQIIAWINITPGIILFVLGFWAGTLAKYDNESKEIGESVAKEIRVFTIIASIILLVAFPIGTFIGITLLRESWMLQRSKWSKSEEIKIARDGNVKDEKT